MSQTEFDKISDVLEEKVTKAKIRGWLHHRRTMGGLLFLIVRDGTGLIQCTLTKEAVGESLFREIEKLSRESVVEIRGNRKEEKRAPGGCEIVTNEIEIISKAEKGFPIPARRRGWLRRDKTLEVCRKGS